MILEAIVYGAIVASISGYVLYDNKRIDNNAKKNQDKIRDEALKEIDRAGLDVEDFPKYEDALRGDRHLKVNEIVDLYYICRTRRRK